MNTVPFAFCDAVFATLVDLNFENSTRFAQELSSNCGYWKAAFDNRRRIRFRIDTRPTEIWCLMYDVKTQSYLNFEEFYQIRPTTLRIESIELFPFSLFERKYIEEELFKLLRYIVPLVNSTHLEVDSDTNFGPAILEILQKVPFSSLSFWDCRDVYENFLKEQLTFGQLKKLRMKGFSKWNDSNLNRRIEELKAGGLVVW